MNALLPHFVAACAFVAFAHSSNALELKPAKVDEVKPIPMESFNRGGKARERRQGGNPRTVAGYQLFDGSMDGNRQVDPQIAVGGGYVFHGTNGGLIIYDKKGNFVQGVSQGAFNGGIDPKLFFDPHNKVFGFDLWNPWDKEKLKPVNIAVSATDDPTKAWNIYPIPAPNGKDGGGIGYSRKWIGYEYPGDNDRNFVLRMKDAIAGNPVKVYRFTGHIGHPVATQDPIDELYFLRITGSHFMITKIDDGEDGEPVATLVANVPHEMKHFGWPPKSPQKGTDQVVSSGDRNPKNLVLQSGCIWFSHAISYQGRSAVQWHQIKLDGTLVQRGLVSHPINNYIQTTIAVNSKNDVLVGFQEAGPEMFISPRMAFRKADDPAGTLSDVVKLGEGKGAAGGVAWGDYSGSTIDGDNLTDLWTIQSITDEEGKGDTVIVKVPFGDE